MGRPRTAQLALIGIVPLFFSFLPTGRFSAAECASALKLVLSLEQPVIVEPLPARASLHLLNGRQAPVWLYRRARPPATGPELPEEEGGTPPTRGGATVTVHLEPTDPAAVKQVVSPGRGRILTWTGLPHPKLIKVGPSDDFEEKATLQLSPALREGDQPIWGRYRLIVVYHASYTNGPDLERILGLTLWQGEVTSNPVDVELRPPGADTRGSVSGTIVTPDTRTIPDALVSLSDEQEHLVNQVQTDLDGRFSFPHLPLGLYWITVRRAYVTEDTTTFQHVELSAAQPEAAVQIVMLPPETYEPQKVLHKPVLFRVEDNSGRPLSNVEIEAVWSNGPIMDNVKGKTGDDGIAVLNLIPGRNYVTLKRHGCPKQDERSDVAPGAEGIDGFKMVFDCAKK